jgi:hypothetical protein
MTTPFLIGLLAGIVVGAVLTLWLEITAVERMDHGDDA